MYYIILYYLILYHIILFTIMYCTALYIIYYIIYIYVCFIIYICILYYCMLYCIIVYYILYFLYCTILCFYFYIIFTPQNIVFYEIGWYLFCCILNLKSIFWGPKLQFLQFVAIQPFPNYIGFKIQDSEKLLWTQGGWIQDSKRSGWLLLWLAKFRRCPNVRPFSGAYELEDHRAP